MLLKCYEEGANFIMERPCVKNHFGELKLVKYTRFLT